MSKIRHWSLGRSGKQALFLATSLAAGGLAASAQAQAVAVDELVVTARSREERLIDVPDTITVFNAQRIEAAGIDQLNDFVRLTPGVSLVEASQSPGIALINIRGVGQQYQSEAPVAVVVDGVQTASVSAINQDLVDVERIEVLKGPQGALYGRNAIGGAINITTKAPTNTFEGRVLGGYANGSDEKIEAVVSGPIVADKLLFRAAAHYNDFDGVIRNATTGQNVDALRREFARLRLLATPTDGLTLDLRASYDRMTNVGYQAIFLPGGDTGDFSQAPLSGRPGYGRLTVSEYAGKLSYETDLGVLSSTTAYVETRDRSDYDLDQTPAPILDLNLQLTGIKAFSQEVRFTSPGDQPLRYTFGAYYLDSRRTRTTDVEIIALGAHLPADVREHNRAWAIFGQANYDLTERLELTLAGRYDRDKRRQNDRLAAPGSALAVVENPFSKFQPKASLAYKVSPQTNLYATFAKGFRSGGFNTPGPAFERIYNSEVTTNYEAGLKTSAFSGRMSLNLAAFLTDFQDQQVQLVNLATGQQGIVNIPKTRNQGVEADLSARLGAGLTLTAGVGYLDSEIRDFPALSIVEGNRPPYSPKLTYNLALDYARPLDATWDLTLRAALSGQSGMYYEYYDVRRNAGLPYALQRQPAYNLVDLRASLRNRTWMITVFGDNVGNVKYYSDATSALITGFGDLGVRGRARRYGIEVGYSF